jgi:hypothetical protein
MVTDELGNWEELGTASFGSLQLWQILPITQSLPLILRFTFLVDWDRWENYPVYRSYARARFYYDELRENVSPSFPLYPKQQSEIRKMTGLVSELPTKKIGVMQYSYSRNKFINTDLIPWQLKIEKFVL